MKIEVNCAVCNSLLRVGAEHAGKQLRCPSCNNLSPIPGVALDEKFKQPLEDIHQPQPEYINPIPTVEEPKETSEALIFGVLGIVLNIGCGGCLLPLTIIINLFGLYLSFKKQCKFKMAAIITNAISLAIACVWVLMFFMW